MTTGWFSKKLRRLKLVFLAMPLDVIRTRLVAQGEPKVYRSTFHAARKIWRYEKIPGFFRGIVPSLSQVAPYTGKWYFLTGFNAFFRAPILSLQLSEQILEQIRRLWYVIIDWHFLFSFLRIFRNFGVRSNGWNAGKNNSVSVGLDQASTPGLFATISSVAIVLD